MDSGIPVFFIDTDSDNYFNMHSAQTCFNVTVYVWICFLVIYNDLLPLTFLYPI